MNCLKKNKVPRNTAVITIDDGWASTKSLAHPILKKNKFNYTVYCSTYYTEKNTPVFNCALQYLYWKSQKGNINIFDNIKLLQKNMPACGNEKLDSVIHYGQNCLDNTQRLDLLKSIMDCMGFNHEKLFNKRLFSFMNYSELEELVNDNVDLQLHTHRHLFPTSEYDARKEILDNMKCLSKVTKKPLKHFCYPSGIWHPKHFNILKKLGIESATLTYNGINYSKQNLYKMKRFVDGEINSQIAFEAEISGFLDLLRSAIIRRD